MTPSPSSPGLSSPSPPSRDRSSPTPQPARGPAVARVVKVLGSVVAAGLLASAAPVIALRDVAPATTAFMLRYTLTGDGPPLRYQWVDSDQIAPALALAAVASEDQKFPVHRGFDRAAMTKALASNRAGGQLRGASTISQQVAKNLFLWPARSWLRKGVEAYFTVLIETLWSKQRILEVYLNVAEFGPGIYGAEAAARHYFDRAAANLTAEQSALLAATLPSPSHSRPDRPSDYLRSRATWIRTQMRQLGPDYLVTPRPLAGDGR